MVEEAPETVLGCDEKGLKAASDELYDHSRTAVQLSIHPLSMAAATAAHPSSDHRQRRDLSHDKALVGLLSDKASCSLYVQHAKGLRRVGIGRLRGWHSEACPRM